MRVKIICGDGHIISDDELRDIKIVREIDPLSINLIINTCDFVYQPKEDYLLAAQQHIDVYYDDILHGRFYIDTTARVGESVWNIKSYDAIGLLGDYKYMGNMFNRRFESLNKPWVDSFENRVMPIHEIIAEIIETAASGEINYTISSEIPNEKMYGYIPICSCREALAQICFSLGAVADTSQTTGINIYPLMPTVSQAVGQNRIARDIRVNELEKVSEIKLIIDDYYNSGHPKNEKTYNKVCKDEKIEFSPPRYDMRFEYSKDEGNGKLNGEFSTDPDTGKILASANYAVINISDKNTTFESTEYELRHTSHIKKLSDSVGKTVELSKYIFVSENNVEAILTRCADYYSKKLKLTVKIYESGGRLRYGQRKYGQVRYGQYLQEGSSVIKYGQAKYGQVQYGQYIYEPPVKIGEIIEMDLGYLGEMRGRIISERYNLNGNIILKECEILIL